MRCFLHLGLVLLSLAPSTWSFSHGANDDSCQEMVPGHIRAQRQYLQHSHISLRTSASSYLPGQLITVTVRSSRDFMGFLLQARSADGAWDRSRARIGAKARLGARAGVKSPRVGPVLVGGSWTLTPPGTHTLRCLSEDDTITHSDKQLKRNLSFVWKAPDTPMGDIQFYITVVQSYFVYWAGIESGVVRDGSRRLWSEINATTADAAVHKEEATLSPALRVHTQSITKFIGSDTTKEATTKMSRATQIYNFSATPTEATHLFLEKNSSETLTSFRNKEGSPVTYTKDHNIFPITSSYIPKPVSLSSDDTTRIKSTAPFMPDSKMKSSSTQNPKLHFLEQFYPLNYSEINKKDPDITFHDLKMHATLNSTSTSSDVPSTTQHFSTTRHQSSTLIPPKSLAQTSSVKLETQSSFSFSWSSLTKSPNIHLKPWLQLQTSSPRPVFNSEAPPFKRFVHAYKSSGIAFPPASTPISYSQTSANNANHSFNFSPTTSFWHLFNKHIKPKNLLVSDSPKPGIKSTLRQTSPPYLQVQTTAGLNSLSSVPKEQSFATHTSTQDQEAALQIHQTQSEIPLEASSISYKPLSQSPSQTEVHRVQTSEWTPSLSLNPKFSSSLIFTSRPVDHLRPDEGQQQKVQPEKIQTTNPTTHFPHWSGTTQHPTLQSTLANPASSYPASSLSDRSPTTANSSLPSTVASTNPSVGSALFTRSPSFMKKEPKTAPALLALPPPLPLSIPPHTSYAQPSYTPTVQPLSSGTNPSSNNLLRNLSALFSGVPKSFASSSSPFTSPTLPLSYTISPVTSSSSSTVSLGSSMSSTTSPPSPFTSSSSSSSNQSSSSSSTYSLFHSTTPYPGPSPAPRRSLYNPLVSSQSPVSLHKPTVGQSLLIHKVESSKPEPNLNRPTPRTVVYPIPLPNPNPNFKQNFDNDLKPDTEPKPKRPSIPSKPPDKDGKYPDIVPRHSTWELGMLLGCSAGLGMVLVVGVRYMYRQACGKQTEMTLNDREREYGRGERGLIHVQECGDLVRVRRIRENSFVLLAEYDILSSPGD